MTLLYTLSLLMTLLHAKAYLWLCFTFEHTYGLICFTLNHTFDFASHLIIHMALFPTLAHLCLCFAHLSILTHDSPISGIGSGRNNKVKIKQVPSYTKQKCYAYICYPWEKFWLNQTQMRIYIIRQYHHVLVISYEGRISHWFNNL